MERIWDGLKVATSFYPVYLVYAIADAATKREARGNE